MTIIFWISVLVLFYTYFGYPLLLWVGSKLFPKPVRKKYITPRVSFVVVAYNEEEHIRKKIENILSLDYPKDKLEVIIGSDGSTDKTNEILKSQCLSDPEAQRPSDPVPQQPSEQATQCPSEPATQRPGHKAVWPGRYRVVISEERKGKVSLLNDIVPQASGEIIVFSDARQAFEVNALKELVANFADKSVGCVSGELIFTDEEENGISKGVGLYWRYEKFMRRAESSFYSMIGATGAIYAIRKKLFRSPPADTILDDVFIPLKVVEQGFRAVFDSNARAYDKAASTSREEFTRKVRTLVGNFQLFSYCRQALNPFKSKIALQFFSHKFLRAAAFVFIAITFISNLFLLPDFPYNFTIIIQVIFYLFAVFGWVLEKVSIKSRLCSLPYVFCVLNFAALKGFLNYLFGKHSVKWEKARG